MEKNWNNEFINIEIPKENAFNAIRLILCIVIVLMHTLGNVGISNKYLLDGHMAVCGFFIISGFWVTKSYFTSESIWHFFKKRIKKIFPMYYISIIGFSIICFYFSNLSPKEYFEIEYVKYIFCNGVFLNFLHPSLPGCFEGNAVNGALWTIKIEIGFYIILPVLIYLWKKIKSQIAKNIYFLILYIISITYNLILKTFAVRWNIPYQLSYQLPGFISFFVSGMFIYLNLNLFLKLKNWLIIPSVIIFFLRYLTNTEILFPAAFAIIIVWSAIFLGFLSFVGKEIDFSWGIYLFHFPIIQILLYSANKNVCIPVYVVSVLGISFMITYLIEKIIKKML